MKRLFVTLVLILCIAFTCIYVFIPLEIKVSSIAVIKANDKALYRSLVTANNWKKFWPKKNDDRIENSIDKFYLNDYTYQAGAQPPDGIEVVITNKNASISSFMQLIPLSVDSMAINWTIIQLTSVNPFTRFRKYLEVKQLESDMKQILARLKFFAEAGKNLYGIDIKQTKVTDTLLMVKKTIQKEEPTVEDIYSYIQDVREFITANNGMITNHPMLHTNYRDDVKSYEVMVAVPVNKRLKGNTSILFKRMVAGNILYAEVKGGASTVEKAMTEMDNYFVDYQRKSPALPYQLLVTDRTKEPDTAKWVTKIYYPVL